MLYDTVDDQLSLHEDEEWWKNFEEALKDEDPVVNFSELTEEELINMLLNLKSLKMY